MFLLPHSHFVKHILTRMQFQIGNIFLQLPPQDDLRTVLRLGAIIDEQEICMSIV